MNWPAYILAWLSAQGRTCAEYEQHTMLKQLHYVEPEGDRFPSVYFFP